MAPQFGKNMPKKPKKAVKRIRRESKENKEKKRMQLLMRNKMNAKKRKVLKEVPELLKYLDNGCLKNLEEWLKKLPDELTSMSQNKVKFGSIALKFGMLDASLIDTIRQRLTQLEEERKTLEQTAKAQGSEGGILPPHTPSVNCNLLLPKEYQSSKAWQALLDFLRDGSFEKMGVTFVDRALRLLELGFAKSVHPTMNGEPSMHERIRDKLLKQQALAKAKNAEKAEKQKQDVLILNAYKKNLDTKITWTQHSRTVAHTGLLVSKDPKVIFGPFSLSQQEQEDLLDKARKDAMGTSLSWIHRAVLELYTSSHFATLNKVLRTDGNEAEFQKYAHFLVHLTNALSVLEKLPEDQTTVHRGTGFFELKIQPGDSLVFPAPTSASKSMRVANGFMKSKGIHFVIKALTAKGIENFSLFKHEREVLFPPNSTFEVQTITHDKGEMAKVLPDLTDDDRQDIHTMVVLEQYA